MNNVQILGNLGSDPELRFTPTGKEVCEISVAVRNPSDDNNPDWFRVVCWGKTALAVAEHKNKGDQVVVEGHLKTDQYDDKEGITRYTTKIHAERVHFVGKSRTTDTTEEAA